jgi:uncharacterized protein
VLCVLLTLVGLPGTWLLLIVAVLAHLIADPGFMGPWAIVAAITLCVLAEVAEGLSGAAGASAVGASRRALVGAAGGGLVGAIVGTFIIPVPLAGTLIGGAVGAGVGAVGLELSKEKALRRSTSLYAVGRGAAVGRLLATVIKSVFAVLLLVVVVGSALWN